MNVVFNRVDYAQVGTTSSGQCLRIMKEESGSSQTEGKKSKKSRSSYDKVVVGGQNGILLCLERKNGDTNIVYKTPPGLAISCIRLGGALQTQQDKAFVATHTEVRGFSRKGKQFLVFESNMTEGISSISFLLKVLDGSRLAYEVCIEEIPNILKLFMNDGGFNKQKVLYGTKNGHIGLVDLSTSNGELCFEMETKSFAAVTAIDCHRILDSSGTPDIIIAKEDGLIEIYAVDENDLLNFRQLYQCDESVTGMECGKISSELYSEIVVCTYTGWVFALTTDPSVYGEQGIGQNTSQLENAKQTPQLEVKVLQLKNELDELEAKVREERDRFLEGGKNQQRDESFALTNIPPFIVNDKFVLRKELACYTLSIELAIPIDYVLLQSDVRVDLMDVERNSAVVSVTQSEPGSGNALLAVYRCQADTTRMEMRIRSIEGQFGTLKIYIVPRLLPLTCQVNEFI
ncbi:bardet-Biedl syndrome 7 protein like protein [Ditylenchus destructor]|nr:bardet-Biedl syndrome 7 protein like protein [Ditylenchus destructor]